MGEFDNADNPSPLMEVDEGGWNSRAFKTI
jgi:hypothetical protein